MKAEQTEVIRVYLRYQSAEDVAIQRRMKLDVMRGRAKSAIARDALRAYYNPPAPPAPAPEVVALTQQVHELTRLVAALSRQVHDLHDALAGLDAVRAHNAQLQALLLASVYGNRDMKRAAIDAAAALATGNGNGKGNGHGAR